MTEQNDCTDSPRPKKGRPPAGVPREAKTPLRARARKGRVAGRRGGAVVEEEAEGGGEGIGGGGGGEKRNGQGIEGGDRK